MLYATNILYNKVLLYFTVSISYKGTIGVGNVSRKG